MSQQLRRCCEMRGRVGAMKTAIAFGNQRMKLYMTVAAIRVLPVPVGSDTSVFARSALCTIACW